MTKAKFPPKPFFLYGVAYASRAEAIEKLGLRSYGELQTHINRYRKGLPFKRRKLENMSRHEKLEKFKAIYRKHGLPLKEDNDSKK